MQGQSDITLILGRFRPSKQLTSTQVLIQFAALHGGTLQSSTVSRKASCQLLAKEWALNTGKLPPGGLSRNSVVR